MVFLFAWIPIKISGYSHFTYFTHFYTIGCYTENNAQVLELLVFPMIGNFGTSLSAKAVAFGSWILAVESLYEIEAANMSIGRKEHKSGIRLRLWLLQVFGFFLGRTEHQFSCSCLLLFFIMLFEVFFWYSEELLDHLTYQAKQIKAKFVACSSKLSGHGFNGNPFLLFFFLNFKFGKSLSVLFSFCMFKGLLLHIWSYHFIVISFLLFSCQREKFFLS